VLITSTQNGFPDLLDCLSFLTAREYLHDVLVKTHGANAPDAGRRCVKIVPHVRIASAYIRQSLEGPSEIYSIFFPVSSSNVALRAFATEVAISVCRTNTSPRSRS
jgi:hypothetical protein